jgi:GTP diphosphokinase / guanosine-3',5'-bis(diphosphate) 3'-diphosphatase
VMDFAYAIHSGVGNRAVGARINGEQRPLRTELSNGDVVEIITSDSAEPNPAWLSFVKTGRARSKIRHHLKTLAQEKTHLLGERMLEQALRSEGIASLPDAAGKHKSTWDKLLRFTGNKSREELLSDIGMGKRIASMVGKKLAVLLAETGLKPDAVLISTERYAAGQDGSVSQGVVSLDGSEGLSVQFARCCQPIPGDRIVGYLGRGEGLIVHTDDCPTGRRLLARDGERFLLVEWADEPVRPFETTVIVTVTNGKGVLARVASAIAAAEADITHLDMGDEPAQTATDIRFSIAVRDRVHLAEVLRSLKRTASVIKAQRYRASGSGQGEGAG